MDLVYGIVSGIVSAVAATAILTLMAVLWRRWVLRKYGLTREAKHVLEALWDENLLRRASQIATELNLDASVVDAALTQLSDKRLVRIRMRKSGEFWKITLKGKEYLSQLSRLGKTL
ncbi:MAG: hypothetical protein ACE5G0_21595 [Rhodothermales bacterium]